MSYTQDGRPLAIQTPLGKDKLLLIGLNGQEAISQLFSFQLEALAENKTVVAFDKLLGQKVTVELELPEKKKRFFNGIVRKAVEGEQGAFFTEYSLEIVPHFWLLTRKAQSRIFQHMSVPDILKKVFDGLEVSFELKGTFFARDYCVQYRETDFSFACRLMEEEGIYYFFKHSATNHQMVVANTPESHSDVQAPVSVIYETVEGGLRDEDRIHTWVKTQELRSGKYTLWDHSFELPHKNLEAKKSILDSVSVGSVTHKLNVGNNQKMELYDFPGEYAQRFDGISGGGGEQPEDLQKIFQDNQRTVEIRMQEEALSSLLIQGASGCGQFTSGHKFKLERHFNADGEYVLTSLQHFASVDNYRSNGAVFSYSNTFNCIPSALPFRPPRSTAKPIVPGTQSAVVVGPGGEEIFTDKYGRVKVQFHWDREGKNNADSSCWLRVTTHWSGKHWGMIHIPRIGQEVVVGFLEGDPDQPIIVGSVYNADMMPPYELPANKTQSGIKTRSSLNGSPANFNEIRFEDKKGSEQLYIHAEKNEDIVVENNKTENVGHDETVEIGHDRTEKVDNDQSITVLNNDTLNVVMNQSITIGNSQDETIGLERSTTIGVSDSLVVGASHSTAVGASDALMVGASISQTAGGAISQTAGGAISVTAEGIIAITSGAALTITSAATIAITAPLILLNGRPVLPIPLVPI
jgi:type VI secretion system secreted protein VgrG